MNNNGKYAELLGFLESNNISSVEKEGMMIATWTSPRVTDDIDAWSKVKLTINIPKAQPKNSTLVIDFEAKDIYEDQKQKSCNISVLNALLRRLVNAGATKEDIASHSNSKGRYRKYHLELPSKLDERSFRELINYFKEHNAPLQINLFCERKYGICHFSGQKFQMPSYLHKFFNRHSEEFKNNQPALQDEGNKEAMSKSLYSQTHG